VTSHHVRAARRNAYVLGATGLTVGTLFLFPSSTNRTGHLARPGRVAPAGVVSSPAVTGPHQPAATTRTVNGKPFDTRFGPVQVQLQLRGRRIVRATAIVYPQGTRRDREINAYAIPVLQQETVAAQSARIDTVSGATYTTQGYVGSLQSALDAALR
jgi:hypothetical protein